MHLLAIPTAIVVVYKEYYWFLDDLGRSKCEILIFWKRRILATINVEIWISSQAAPSSDFKLSRYANRLFFAQLILETGTAQQLFFVENLKCRKNRHQFSLVFTKAKKSDTKFCGYGYKRAWIVQKHFCWRAFVTLGTFFFAFVSKWALLYRFCDLIVLL